MPILPLYSYKVKIYFAYSLLNFLIFFRSILPVRTVENSAKTLVIWAVICYTGTIKNMEGFPMNRCEAMKQYLMENGEQIIADTVMLAQHQTYLTSPHFAISR